MLNCHMIFSYNVKCSCHIWQNSEEYVCYEQLGCKNYFPDCPIVNTKSLLQLVFGIHLHLNAYKDMRNTKHLYRKYVGGKGNIFCHVFENYRLMCQVRFYKGTKSSGLLTVIDRQSDDLGSINFIMAPKTYACLAQYFTF